MDVPPLLFSAKAYRTGEQPISYLMHEAVTRRDLINLGAGLVDYDSLPVDAVRQSAQNVLAEVTDGRRALQYGTTPGLAGLREAWLNYLAQLDGLSPRDLSLTPANMILTTGSQQGLYLITDVLVDPGDVVIVSAPSYFVYTHALASFGADVRTVPMDENGMRLDCLEVLLEGLAAANELGRLKLIYVVSSFQNPTGISLSTERRQRLVELVRTYSHTHRILILEDAAYRELRYHGPDRPSIKSFDRENHYVVLATTFSKSFSPGAKTGALTLPDDLVAPVLWQKGNHDFGSQNLGQHIVLDALRSSAYASQVDRLRRVYVRKRDAMLAALDRHLSHVPGVTWIRPEGGLYVWMSLPEDWDASPSGELFRHCIHRGVMYVPGAYCHTTQCEEPVPVHELRLSFGAAPPEAITEGVRRLAEVVHEFAAGAAVDLNRQPERA